MGREVVQVRIGGPPLGERGQLAADHLQGEPTGGDIRGITCGKKPHLVNADAGGFERSGTWSRLVDAAENR